MTKVHSRKIDKNEVLKKAMSRIFFAQKRRKVRSIGITDAHVRADIQGLRAFAVIAVILDHFFEWPSGGFIGVDVFFVISGFLITGHLLREISQTGRVSIKRFYAKRMKRILPAAGLVLVVSVLASYAIFNQARSREVLWDGIWASLFAANWRFASIGTDYFQADGPVSPLQHFWSLAVEEQFYFVWPVLLLIAFVFLGRRLDVGRHLHLIAGALVATILTASFLWAVYETNSNPGLAYFSTFSRGWELAAGAGLACVAPYLAAFSGHARLVMAWTGLAGLSTSLFIIDASAAFPAPAALLPVCATMLIIAAGTNSPPSVSLAVLTNPASRYLGDISYSLYLWHFPVFIFGSALLPQATPHRHLVVLAATAFFAIIAYNLWEDPIRKSSWLAGAKKHGSKSQLTTRTKFTALTALFVVSMVTVAWSLVPTQAPSKLPTLPNSEVSQEGPPVEQTSPYLAKVQSSIQTALNTPSWPDLNPSLDELGTANWVSKLESSSCSDVTETNVSSCYFPASVENERHAVLYGDSFAMAWSAGVRAALNEAGYSVQLLTRGQCPAASVSVVQIGGEAFPDCDRHRDWAISVVNDMKPDLVILASAQSTLSRLASKAEGKTGLDEYSAGVTGALKSLSASGADTVVLSSPPRGKNLQECVTNLSRHSDCSNMIAADWYQYRDAEKEASETVGSTYVDTSLWFCNAAGNCPAFVGDTPVRTDSEHITVEYSSSLSGVILEALHGHL